MKDTHFFRVCKTSDRFFSLFRSASFDIPVAKQSMDAPQAKVFTVTLWFKGPKAADNYTAVELIY